MVGELANDICKFEPCKTKAEKSLYIKLPTVAPGKFVSKRLRRESRVLFKKANKIGNVLVPKVPGDLTDLGSRRQEMPLCFQHDTITDDLLESFPLFGVFFENIRYPLLPLSNTRRCTWPGRTKKIEWSPTGYFFTDMSDGDLFHLRFQSP